MHTTNYIDNDLVCPITTYAQPEGNISLVTADMYIIRLVHNIDCLFTKILMW